MSGNSPSYHRDLPTVRGKVHPTLLATSKGLLAPAEASAAWPRAVPVHTVGPAGLGRAVRWPAGTWRHHEAVPEATGNQCVLGQLQLGQASR